MSNKVLETPVDEMMNYLILNKKATLSSLKLQLKLPEEIIERWLVILEEFNILKIHYDGFEAQITLIEGIETNKNKLENINIDNLKETFIRKSKIKGMSSEKINLIWPKFLENYKQDIKDLFFEKAKAKDYPPNKINLAWEKYWVSLEVL